MAASNQNRETIMPTHKTTSQSITRDDAKHTPTPWVQGDNGLIYGQCQGDNDEAPFVADVVEDTVSAVLGIMSPEEAANAALIVRAVNSYEQLVRYCAFREGDNAGLLQAAGDLLDALEAQTEAAQAVIDNWSEGDLAAAVRTLDGSIEGARAAIAKAKGGGQ